MRLSEGVKRSLRCAAKELGGMVPFWFRGPREKNGLPAIELPNGSRKEDWNVLGRLAPLRCRLISQKKAVPPENGMSFFGISVCVG